MKDESDAVAGAMVARCIITWAGVILTAWLVLSYVDVNMVTGLTICGGGAGE